MVSGSWSAVHEASEAPGSQIFTSLQRLMKPLSSPLNESLMVHETAVKPPE